MTGQTCGSAGRGAFDVPVHTALNGAGNIRMAVGTFRICRMGDLLVD